MLSAGSNRALEYLNADSIAFAGGADAAGVDSLLDDVGLATQPRVLLRVAQARQLAILLVTHDIDEALYLSDGVLLLGPGTLDRFAVPAARPRVRGASDQASAAVKRALLEQLQAAHAFQKNGLYRYAPALCRLPSSPIIQK